MAHHQRYSGLVVQCSADADPQTAVHEIAAAIGVRAMAGGLLFCSHRYPREALSEAVRSRLGGFPLPIFVPIDCCPAYRPQKAAQAAEGIDGQSSINIVVDCCFPGTSSQPERGASAK